MRVYELAKELELSSKDILGKLHVMGVEAKNHMTVLDEASIAAIRKDPTKFVPPPPAPPKKKKEPAPAPTPAVIFVTEPVTAPVKKVEAPVVEEPDAPPPKKTAAAAHKPAEKEKAAPHPKAQPPAPQAPPAPPPDKTIRVRGPIIVKDLADKLGIRPNRLIAELMSINVLASITERVDVGIARKIAEKHGFAFEHEKKTAELHGQILKKREEEEDVEEIDQPEDLMPRPPVVTFMGHVDHGKTSLLDKIRNTAVAKSEHGGITQHIGAYTKEIGGRSITFLDTPGHAAFTSMRARGANLTDIAVIVIAADDGVMPQTKEAITHAKAAEVAIMVAMNKMDLPGANPDMVKKHLQNEGLAPEDWGGTTICVPVSAITGLGIDHLLEMILLQADVLELRANPKRKAKGFVIESKMEPGMGPTASLLVTTGTLNLGDIILCGQHWGRVRALINDHGVKVKSAPPSTPIMCLGLSGVPEAGAEFRVCPNDKIARSLAEAAATRNRQEQMTATPKKASLEDLFSQMKDQKKLELKIILKADSQGSVEAITHALKDIKSDKVSLDVMHGATGNIHPNDIMLASASNAVVFGFHVAKEPGIDAVARHEGVEVRLHHIIYELVDEVRDAMAGLLAPEVKVKVMGHVEVKQVFPISKGGNVAGCQVKDGYIRAKHRVRVKRGSEVLFEGSIASLKRFKDSVSEVKEGQECGIRLDNFNDFAVGDILEACEIEHVKQDL